MTYAKLYERINWINKQTAKITAVGASNLNKIDYTLNELDDRVVSLDIKKAEQSTVLNMVSNWTMNKETGLITVTKLNGEQIMFDLNIEKIPVSFSLSEDGILTMTTDDGSVFVANIGAMIPVITFENSETISVTTDNRKELATDFSEYVHQFDSPFTGNIIVKVVPLEEGSPATTQYSATLILEDGSIVAKGGGGITEEEFVFGVENLVKITVKTGSPNNIVALYTETNEKKYRFDVKEGSINDKHLQPNYLADIKVQAENAELSANASANSAEEAKGYAEQAKESAESVSGAVGDIALNRQTLGYVKKNLYRNTLTERTLKGITLTKNEDDSIRFTGTPTLTSGTVTFNDYKSNFLEANKEYRFSVTNKTKGACNIYLLKQNGVFGEGYVLAAYIGYDYTSVKFSITEEQLNEYPYMAVQFGVVYSEANVDVTLYPMIRSADITDGTYEPFVDDVDTRLKKVETEVMPIERGGTGASTAKEAQYNLLNDMNALTNEVADGTIFLNAYSSPTSENGAVYKRTALSLWNYIKSKIEGITVTNLLATVAGKPLDATMGKALNDKIETLGGFTPVIDETTGKITGYTTTIGGADTVFPFKSVVHCGSYTANGSFDVTTYGLSNVKKKNFIFVPTLTQTWVYGTATKIPYTNYEYARGFGGYKPHTFALSGNILTFTLPICTGSAYCGPTASNASAEVGEAYTLPIAGDIYYIG